MARDLKLGLNTGYDFVIRNLTVGPRVGLNYRETNADGFSERGGTGLELHFLPQSQASLTSVVGAFTSMAFSTGFGVLVPQVTAEWVHEFENGQKFHEFYFVQDLTRQHFRFLNDGTDSDYFNVGGGLVVVLPGGLSPFVNYREMLGFSHQHNRVVTAGIRFSF